MKRRRPMAAEPINAGLDVTSAISTLARTSGYPSTWRRIMPCICEAISGPNCDHTPPSITVSTSQMLIADAMAETMASMALSTTAAALTSPSRHRSISSLIDSRRAAADPLAMPADSTIALRPA